MKPIKFVLLLLFTGVLFTACSDDDSDDSNPDPVIEEATITTLNIALFEPGASDASVVLLSRDLGSGNAPDVTVTGTLNSDTTYNGIIEVFDETVTPAENITLQIEEEDDQYQFFFETIGNITDVSYADEDENGNPVGLSFTLTTGGEGVAFLTVTLLNEPQKPNNGTLAGAGGDTEFTRTFSNLIIN